MSLSFDRRKAVKAATTTAATFTILQTGSAKTYAANEKLSIPVSVLARYDNVGTLEIPYLCSLSE